MELRKVTPLALLALAGCMEDTSKPRQPTHAAQTVERQVTEARTAAEFLLRSRLRINTNLTMRGVVVHRQALGNALAVCGQINPSGRSDDPFIPFVAVITFDESRVERTALHLAASSAEATRVYIEFFDRCFDGGGPTVARGSVRPIPPLPDTMPTPAPQVAPRAPQAALPPQPPPPPAPAAIQTPASGTVTTASHRPVNIRSVAGGSGDVVRVVPRASTLQVFGEGPGGWLLVGDGAPWGWVHSSMLERR